MSLGKISRREFLNSAGSFILATGSENLDNIASAGQAQNKKIIFEQARANPRLRQQYIDQLVAEASGDDAGAVVDGYVYDSDRSQALRAKIQYTARGLYQNKDKIVEETFRGLRKDPRLRGYSDEILRERIDLKFNSEVQRKVEESALYIIFILSNAEGVTVPTRTSGKSRIYVFNTLFEHTSVMPYGLDLILGPSEERIRGALKHEQAHALTYAHGLKLGENLFVKPSDFHNINPDVMNFVDEAQAYIKEADEVKKLGYSSTAYSESVLVLVRHLYNSLFDPKRLLNPKAYTGLNKRLLDYQLAAAKEAEKRHPLIIKYMEAAVLYHQRNRN